MDLCRLSNDFNIRHGSTKDFTDFLRFFTCGRRARATELLRRFWKSRKMDSAAQEDVPQSSRSTFSILDLSFDILILKKSYDMSTLWLRILLKTHFFCQKPAATTWYKQVVYGLINCVPGPGLATTGTQYLCDKTTRKASLWYDIRLSLRFLRVFYGSVELVKCLQFRKNTY